MNKTKTCTKCGEVKPVDCFGKRKASKDGLRKACKSCDAEQSRKYYEENKNTVAERQRKYREENKDKVAERHRKYRKENKDKVIKYREANKDKIAEKGRKYREENKDKVVESKRRWQKDNSDKVRAKRQRRRALKAGAAGNCTAEQLKARFDYYGNKCYNCGSDEKLHADHRIPLSRGGSNHPANFVPLCRSCNCSKGTKTETEFKSQTQQETTHTH